MNFPIGGSDILKLIPQRHPMLMINELLRSSSIEAYTSFYVGEDCIFIEDNKLNAFGLIENIAQSAAAMNGITDYINKSAPRLGFIGEIKDFKLFELPSINQILITHISLITKVENISLIKGEVCNQKKFIFAETKLKISMQDE